MGKVRTNITLDPAGHGARSTRSAGPRGRSGYIAEAVQRQLRHDRARLAFGRAAGALSGSTTWGRTPDETLEIVRNLRSNDTAR